MTDSEHTDKEIIRITQLYELNVTAKEIAIALRIPYQRVTQFTRSLALQKHKKLQPGELGRYLLQITPDNALED